MQVSFEELCKKEVIDISTGERLGFIDDVELDLGKSAAGSLIIYGGMRILGLFGREEDVIISCDEIRVVGSDVVLVELSRRSKETYFTNNGRKRFSSLLK